ncbi:IMP cyclohydrolase [Paenibacillus harenae]|uniref:Inosine monophosphate cyclohydrolase-like domain-containing protein n=1 Tax=Paenibacillus harenae TaxID=306543 RepID=A0ABT9U7Q1_PAEHA|nr:IMP cyclohydrolase [Paenibacillus harenae]MDQ0063585.1 hypothetical protein [Paenibacillus harenae]MDQ0115672.1 hypothetical protein [Paenibacillus harenae]
MTNVEQQLFANPYPGRTLTIGMTPSGEHYAQIYWIMGRSDNSRNRVFELDGHSVRNAAYDPSKLEDPSLIIYHPIRVHEEQHIVSNGDQTDTLHDGFAQGLTFEDALKERQYEPDPPHYTPRISGVIDTRARQYSLSILKSNNNDKAVCIRNFYHYSSFTPGIGHCIHTYRSEEHGVLRPFIGEPIEIPIFDSMKETADFYWRSLNEDNKISLLVKYISVQDHTSHFVIINKNR